MRKSFIIIAMITMFIILLSGCSIKDENTDTLLYVKGLELVEKMDKMVKSEEYLNLMSVSPELVETIKRIGEDKYFEPKMVYKITISEKATEALYKGFKIAELPEELRKEVNRRLITGIPYQINAFKGSVFVAASSVAATGDSFISDGLKNNTIYIYIYEGEYSAMVSFFPGDENIVSTFASFVINDSLNQITSDSEMSEWVSQYMNLMDCEIERVKITK